MSVLNRIMSYDKNKKLSEICNCGMCNQIIEKQVVNNLLLSEKEIEQIIKERYWNKDEKTKLFIRKALKVHGDRYDYSKVVYIKAREKVEIICKIDSHKSFLQTPNKHIDRKQGCPICKGKRKLTTEEFIKRAKEIHGDKYDYSKVEYKNSNENVEIICKIKGHSSFFQRPKHHLSGSGCPKCSGKYTYTFDEFVKKAKEIHGNKYDYSETKYINNKTKICIICSKHGKYWQIPFMHINGQSCPKCANEIRANKLRITREEFIEKAREVHDNKYDYSKVNYEGMEKNVTIVCPKHGEFLQTPTNHLQGKGCSKCSGKYKPTTDEFIERARKVHDNKYNYSKIDYKGMKTKVIITCPIHGDFSQTPDNHLKTKGCPKCNKNKGEESIRKFLTEKGIEFEEQKTFDGCKNKRLLKFDFYLPKYNLCIESDGNVHSEKINWNGKMTDTQMEENLKSNQYRDDIKNKYCEKNGIILLRVNNLRAVKELTKYFQNNGIIKK